jgi:hypothetical protein
MRPPQSPCDARHTPAASDAAIQVAGLHNVDASWFVL